MLNPDWRRLTSVYVRQQKARDQKLKEIRYLLPAAGRNPTVTETIALLGRIREIVEANL